MHMHIFEGAHHLSYIEWMIRAITAYVFLIFVAKTMGQRSIAQLRFLDVVLVLLLEGNLSNALSDERVGLLGSMITTCVLIVLHIVSSVLTLKWDRWRRFLEPSPIILIHNGSIDFSNLKKARITVEYLFSELRLQNVSDIKTIRLALWEASGTVSVFQYPEHETVSRLDMKVAGRKSPISFILVKNGNIQKDVLALLGKTETWAQEELSKKISVELVQLATIDENKQINILLKK
ncbi:MULTISPECIES: DUF421 domain-containing protein [Bacillus cereus group]|uniref:DUF421 domain-containing protein n=1 Tax=Bacillus cereus group TaxID=86661 RepID=UPI000330FA2F|nr:MULTISPECIES: YetF domain-containing protein [Bacillus cereus group]EOP50716.1 hypothetical protein IIW_02917 [Bacillus cereus VD136]EOP66865.1 hypothetical protein KOW_01644 [Bacillus cereus VDM006]EOQ03391.1 hypothetical protein KOY_01241 [Bacillus cereus VDM021]OOG94880.1 hypothetical protein BTH41_00436 [Bacillus mycoides]MDF2082751.1 DUF421 domain-containing protein [Bacillus pseudomycoides]